MARDNVQVDGGGANTVRQYLASLGTGPAYAMKCNYAHA